jgi:hypothetical protein
MKVSEFISPSFIGVLECLHAIYSNRMKTRERLNGISWNFEASLKFFRTLQFYLKSDKNKRRFTQEMSVYVQEFLCLPRTLIIKHSLAEKIFLAKAVDINLKIYFIPKMLFTLNLTVLEMFKETERTNQNVTTWIHSLNYQLWT